VNVLAVPFLVGCWAATVTALTAASVRKENNRENGRDGDDDDDADVGELIVAGGGGGEVEDWSDTLDRQSPEGRFHCLSVGPLGSAWLYIYILLFNYFQTSEP
jgi:hypothetical protein